MTEKNSALVDLLIAGAIIGTAIYFLTDQVRDNKRKIALMQTYGGSAGNIDYSCKSCKEPAIPVRIVEDQPKPFDANMLVEYGDWGRSNLGEPTSFPWAMNPGNPTLTNLGLTGTE